MRREQCKEDLEHAREEVVPRYEEECDRRGRKELDAEEDERVFRLAVGEDVRFDE